MLKIMLALVMAWGCVSCGETGAPPAPEPTPAAGATAVSTGDPEAAAPDAPAPVKMINRLCPVMPDQPAVPEFIVHFRGQAVGLCCEDCLPIWDDMSDAEKEASLADVK